MLGKSWSIPSICLARAGMESFSMVLKASANGLAGAGWDFGVDGFVKNESGISFGAVGGVGTGMWP